MTRAIDVNLTAIFQAENIDRIRAYPGGRFCVVLNTGEIGVGGSVGEALEAAKAQRSAAA